MNKQILVVEDELVVAKNIQNRLENLGYFVPAVVTSGEEAIKKVADIQPDLILMDIMLESELDGIEAAKQISKRFDIPIIYLTAYGDDQTLQRAKITEPYGYILKPFETRDLQSNIEMALYKHTILSKIKDNEKWLSTVLTSISDAVITTDKEGYITFINPVAETLTDSKHIDVIGKPLETVFKIISEKNHTTGESLVKTIIQGNDVVNLEGRNIILVTKDGKEKPIEDSYAPIKDSEGNITGCIIVFRDITIRKQTESELEQHRQHLEKMVEKRTAELTKFNEQLQQEIASRWRAEKEANKARENLQNIINSASEVIIAIDGNNRVTLWNRTAEILTGYSRSEVSGKNVTKLHVFDAPDQLADYIKSVSNGKKPRFNEIILKRKNGDKRIIKVSCSFVKTNEEQKVGILLVGNDITYDLESHGRLLRGSCYLIPDKENRYALDLFAALCKSDYEGLFITRATPEMIKNMRLLKDGQTVLLSQKKLGGFENIPDLEILINKIGEFTRRNLKSVVLLDGLHYLLTRFSFEGFINALCQINEEVMSNTNSLLLVRLDPSLLNDWQMAVMENELIPLPSRIIHDVEIEDELYNILAFIYRQHQNNAVVSLKNISKDFGITSKTTTKRIKILEDKELIIVKKQGRLKTLHVSKKGKNLINKRQMV